jgi:hypothetical protein
MTARGDGRDMTIRGAIIVSLTAVIVVAGWAGATADAQPPAPAATTARAPAPSGCDDSIQMRACLAELHRLSRDPAPATGPARRTADLCAGPVVPSGLCRKIRDDLPQSRTDTPTTRTPVSGLGKWGL